MPRFAYKGFDDTGRLVDGVVSAADRSSALAWLRTRNLLPVEIREGTAEDALPWWNRDVFGQRALPRHELALFVREFSALLGANIPVDQALNIVALQPMLSANVRFVVRDLHRRVVEGDPLSQAIAARGASFPDYIARLVRAGESSGALGETLEDLATFLEKSGAARARITSAFLYPAVLLAATGMAVAVIMTILIPTVAPLLRDAGAELPWTLVALESVHAFLAQYGVSLLLLLAVMVGAGFVSYTTNSGLRRMVSRGLLAMPFVGGLIRQTDIARFARTLGILCRNDVPILDAITTAINTMSNLALRDRLASVETDVRQGKMLDGALSATGAVPELAVRLIRIGEQTGKLPSMLGRVADIYQATAERRLDRVATLISPIMTIVIGVGVGGLVISIMSALVGLNDLALR